MNHSNGHREGADAALQRLAHELRIEGPSSAAAISITGEDGQVWQIDTIAGSDRLVIHTPVALPAHRPDAETADCLLRINAEVHLTGGAWLALHRPSDTVRLFDSMCPGEAVPDSLSQRVSRLARVLSQVQAGFRDGAVARASGTSGDPRLVHTRSALHHASA